MTRLWTPQQGVPSQFHSAAIQCSWPSTCVLAPQLWWPISGRLCRNDLWKAHRPFINLVLRNNLLKLTTKHLKFRQILESNVGAMLIFTNFYSVFVMILTLSIGSVKHLFIFTRSYVIFYSLRSSRRSWTFERSYWHSSVVVANQNARSDRLLARLVNLEFWLAACKLYSQQRSVLLWGSLNRAE